MNAIDEQLRETSGRAFGKGQEHHRLRGAYHLRQAIDANDAVKQPQRDRIMAHILKYHHTTKPMKLLSMPGLRWPFERELESRFGGTLYVTGLEHNWGTMEIGRPWMIGTKLPVESIFELPIGEIRQLVTDRAQWIWTDAGDFLTLLRRDKGPKKRQRWFSFLFRQHTAAWLDFTGCLSNVTLPALRGLGGYMNANIFKIPIALTLTCGRETITLSHGETSLARRLTPIVAAIQSNGWRECKITDAWQYESNGCHMLNVCAVLTPGLRMCQTKAEGSDDP